MLACALALAAVAPAAGSTQQRLVLSPSSPETTFEVEIGFPDEPGTCEAERRRPMRAVYRGRVEIVRESDGSLSLVNELPFDRYLEGLAEMPRSWPMEALRAQVIAARSYAMYALAHPPPSFSRRGVDICATDRCQVYRGAAVALGAFGERWVGAVRSTRGLALLWRGEPAQAFYFSTSTGRTRSNADVFGGPPRPYLPSVPAYDGDSPLARWRVAVPFADLAPILRAHGVWPGGEIDGLAESGGAVAVSGPGDAARLGKAELRRALNAEAPCLFPHRYPTRSSIGQRLPLTVPSSTYTVRRDGAAALLAGRGWGHDVGMSQYGARSLAERGWNAADILAHFYGGLRPRPVEEPGRIRVLAAEDAEAVRVSVRGSAKAITETGSRLSVGGAFQVRGGRTLRLRREAGPAAAPVLEVGLNTRRIEAAPGDEVAVRFVLNRAARVTVVLARGGEEVARSREESFESGANGARLRLSAGGAPAPLAPGAYAAVVEAFDGIDRVRSQPIPVLVAAPRAVASPAPEDGALPASAVVPAAIALAGAAAWALLRRRGRHAIRR